MLWLKLSTIALGAFMAIFALFYKPRNADNKLTRAAWVSVILIVTLALFNLVSELSKQTADAKSAKDAAERTERTLATLNRSLTRIHSLSVFAQYHLSLRGPKFANYRTRLHAQFDPEIEAIIKKSPDDTIEAIGFSVPPSLLPDNVDPAESLIRLGTMTVVEIYKSHVPAAEHRCKWPINSDADMAMVLGGSLQPTNDVSFFPVKDTIALWVATGTDVQMATHGRVVSLADFSNAQVLVGIYGADKADDPPEWIIELKLDLGRTLRIDSTECKRIDGNEKDYWCFEYVFPAELTPPHEATE